LNTTIDTAIPIGMIVNELITNSFKYAFSLTKNPHIQIDILNQENNYYQLIIKDNGIGLENSKIEEKNNRLGLKLVRLFVEQLNGTYNYSTQNGAVFTINFYASAAIL
jgi:two-component sensor histidine kinase